jgi:DNA modification methylase
VKPEPIWRGPEPLRGLLVPIQDLRPDPKNARKHDAFNLTSIRLAYERFGQQKPVVALADGTVVAGNGQLEASKALGWTHLAVVRTDLKGATARAYGIADNAVGLSSEWDKDVLSEHVKALMAEEFDMKALGLGDEDLAKLMDETRAGLTDPDDVPAPPDEAITKPGDLIILGNHRLVCGDSALAADVDRLLDGAHIHLVNSDPPYNVGVASRSNNAIAASGDRPIGQQGMDIAIRGQTHATTEKMRPKDRPLANDFISDEEFARLLRAWFGNIARVLEPGRAYYLWGGYSNVFNYPNALREAGLYFSQMIIWDKQHPVLTRKDYMGAHEMAYYGWHEGAAHKFFGPPNATDLWHVKKVNPQSMVHLTEKPVELAVRAIQYSSLPGENVLDLFGGSGSTLVACEQTGRHAYLMEIDPLYCDVIIARFEAFSGKKARRLTGADTNVASEPEPSPGR